MVLTSVVQYIHGARPRSLMIRDTYRLPPCRRASTIRAVLASSLLRPLIDAVSRMTLLRCLWSVPQRGASQLSPTAWSRDAAVALVHSVGRGVDRNYRRQRLLIEEEGTSVATLVHARSLGD